MQYPPNQQNWATDSVCCTVKECGRSRVQHTARFATAQCISTKLVLSVSCIYHWMSVYILCTSTKCRLCTTPVVSLPLLPHNPPPFLSPPGRPQADGFPLMCRGSA